MGEDVGGRCRIGDEAVHVGAHVAKGAIEAGAVMASRDYRPMQKVDAALEAAHVAAGARIGEGLIVVVDSLSEETAPDRGRKERARRKTSLPGREGLLPGRQIDRRGLG